MKSMRSSLCLPVCRRVYRICVGFRIYVGFKIYVGFRMYDQDVAKTQAV